MVRKTLPWIIFIAFFALLIIGYSLRDKMNSYVSEMMLKQVSPKMTHSVNALVDSMFNYTANGLNYEITFLEFGSKGCSACKRMESVIEEIGSKYSTKVNVVFLNVSKPESLNLMKLYGIAVIPTQIILDRKGKEFFRHSGYISTDELEKEIIEK